MNLTGQKADHVNLGLLRGMGGVFLPSFRVSPHEKLLIAVNLNWLTGLMSSRIPEAQATDVDAGILHIRAGIAHGIHFGKGGLDGVATM